jgi:hypothetical protein
LAAWRGVGAGEGFVEVLDGEGGAVVEDGGVPILVEGGGDPVLALKADVGSEQNDVGLDGAGSAAVVATESEDIGLAEREFRWKDRKPRCAVGLVAAHWPAASISIFWPSLISPPHRWQR